MDNAFTITINLLAPGLNGAKGLMRMGHHAYRKRRNEWVASVLEATTPKQRSRLSGVHVSITRYSLSRQMDIDNLYASCKIPLDALVLAGVLKDDSTNEIWRLEVKHQRIGRAKDQRTEITIERG